MEKKIQALHYLWIRCLTSGQKYCKSKHGDIKNSCPAYRFIDMHKSSAVQLLFLFNKQEDTESSVRVAQLLFLPTQSNPCSYVPILWNIPCSYMKNFLTCVRSWAGAFQKYWAHNQSSGLPLGTMGIWKQTRISSWCFIHIKISKESQNSHNKLFHYLWLADSYMVPPIPSATKFLVNIFKLCSSFISCCLYFCLYLLTTLFHCFSHHLEL